MPCGAGRIRPLRPDRDVHRNPRCAARIRSLIARRPSKQCPLPIRRRNGYLGESLLGITLEPSSATHGYWTSSASKHEYGGIEYGGLPVNIAVFI